MNSGLWRFTRLLPFALTLTASRVIPAQRVRISGTTWLQSIDLRPLVEDSVPAVEAQGVGVVRNVEGRGPVRCPPGTAYCYFTTSAARQTTNPLLQDLSLAAWGFGEGISIHAHVRARASAGGTSKAWPRLDDRFDALDAYLEVDRSRARVRLGRLWAMNGLGASNYDGGALMLRRGTLSLEAYGGRALVEGLNEAYSSAEIGAVDELPPDENGLLLGARLRARPTALSAVSAVYQRVVRSDRAALYSERVALDGTTRALGTALDASLAYDLVDGAFNEARLRASRRLVGRLDGGVEVRRHRPFFELWTIWGAFSPVGFDEARADISWRGRGERLSLVTRGAYRRYDEDVAGLSFLPLRADGWRTGVDATWTTSERFSTTASYAVDLGFGASRSDASAGIRWTPGSGAYLGASATAFQTIYEFRVGTGRVLGAGVDGALRLTDDVRIAFDGGIYHHRLTNDAPGTDWSQRRASVRFEWSIGSDPGAGARGGR